MQSKREAVTEMRLRDECPMYFLHERTTRVGFCLKATGKSQKTGATLHSDFSFSFFSRVRSVDVSPLVSCFFIPFPPLFLFFSSFFSAFIADFAASRIINSLFRASLIVDVTLLYFASSIISSFVTGACNAVMPFITRNFP